MMKTNEASMSLAQPHPEGLNNMAKIGLALGVLGFGQLMLSLWSIGNQSGLLLFICLAAIGVGTVLFGYGVHMNRPAGIQNHGIWFRSISARGVLGWSAGILLTAFYVLLYWYPAYLGLGENGAANRGIVAFFDPLSYLFKGTPASQWFVYGTLYTVAIVAFGVKFIFKYRHNRYQIWRTVSVMVAQLFFAYLIPEILEGLNTNTATQWFDKDLKNTWPLDYDFFHDWHLNNMMAESTQPIGMTYLVVGVLMFTFITPVVTYFVGKRWYCSWVCGCGGLAETAGDEFRHLSDKSLGAWKLERWLIHSVLVLVVLMTGATLYGYFTGASEIFGLQIYHHIQKPYGFIIGAAFSGVIGVGFYPLLGSRVWCRFGCPMAAYMGLIQRFKSRFRITTNGGQCISCGNCSTYCEQGIDVRWYAQRGENIVRASCVGCGVCSAVCPRGVLKLENGPEVERISEGPIVIGHEGPILDRTSL